MSPVPDNRAYRESAKKVILGKARRLHEEANALEALAQVVPEDERDWPEGAGDLLWRLIMGYSR